MKTVEFHILQSTPDSRFYGARFKFSEFGGHRRYFFFSHYLKRAVRLSEMVQARHMSTCTRLLPEQVADHLIKHGYSSTTAPMVAQELFNALCGMDKDGGKNNLLYIRNAEPERAAVLIQKAGPTLITAVKRLAILRERTYALSDEEKATRQSEIAQAAQPFVALANRLKQRDSRYARPLTTALFGGVVNAKRAKDVPTACKVNYAFSVNRSDVNAEISCCGVDDTLQPNDSSSARIAEPVNYPSCFYRLAYISWEQLVHNLGGNTAAAREGIITFAKAFVRMYPSGDPPTTHPFPALVLVVVRKKGQPISLANAFEMPVRPTQQTSITTEAVRVLSNYFANIQRAYSLQDTSFCIVTDEAADTRALRDAGVEIVPGLPELLGSLDKIFSNMN